jgi:hypothetical protein
MSGVYWSQEMNRRSFLQAIATIAAATATSNLVAAPNQVAPAVDWNAWNYITLSHRRSKLVGYINEHEVTAFPELMQRLCRFFTIDIKTGKITFGGVLSMTVPELDTNAPLIVGASVKFDGDPLRLPSAKEHWFADNLSVINPS